MKHHFFRHRLFQFALLLCVLSLSSCLKEHLRLFKDKNGGFGKPLVFVAGSESNGTNRLAKCWIDGQELTLSDGSHDATANSIFVQGLEVYVAGNDGGPVYWKNNIEISLPVNFGPGVANSIVVSGGHTFIAGTDGGKAVYWKDGNEIVLNTTNLYGEYSYSAANSILISGHDVYLAGLHGSNAVYWKNGVEEYLTTVTPDIIGVVSFAANSIDVSANDVHVVGVESEAGSYAPMPRYWKNGVDESASLGLSNFDFLAEFGTNAVLVSGGNVYISGVVLTFIPYHYTAVYWKNGNITVLPDNNGSSFTSDIDVKGNDVYVSGSDGNRAVYWKNSSEFTLTDGTNNANATSIFVR